MNTNERTKRLVAYSATAAAVIATNAANATIQVNQSALTLPLEITDTAFALDFDGAGTPDLWLQMNTNLFSSYLSSSYTFKSSGNDYVWNGKNFNYGFMVQASAGTGLSSAAGIMVSTASGSAAALGLSSTTNYISSGKLFSSSYNTLAWGSFNKWVGTSYGTYYATNYTFSTGQSVGATEAGGNFMSGYAGTTKYLGMKFTIGGNTHYGWAKIQVVEAVTKVADSILTNPDGPKAYLVNYAYEDVPNYKIGAGVLIATDISKQPVSRANIYSFGKAIHISGATNRASVKVYDLLGKQVYSGTTTGATSKVDMNGHRGTYVVKVNDSTRKVYIN